MAGRVLLRVVTRRVDPGHSDVVVVSPSSAVVVDVTAACPSAMASSSASNVAVSTSPLGVTPRAVWNAVSASVSSGVQVPSTGPVQ